MKVHVYVYGQGQGQRVGARVRGRSGGDEGLLVTAAGRKQLSEQRQSWERFSGAIEAVLDVGRAPKGEAA